MADTSEKQKTPPAASWPENPRIIGTRVPRLDGLAKASGRAKYPSDVRPAGTLFGAVLYSPHAHATIKSIDTSVAEKLPGVRAISVLTEVGKTLRFHGDDIAIAAAESEEQARDAIRAIKVEYEVLPHVVSEAQAMADGAPEIVKGGNIKKGRAQTRGEPEEAMKKAAATIEATYSLPVITHVCLESHGLTASWKGRGKPKVDGTEPQKPAADVEGDERIVAWASTQGVGATANELAQSFELPVANVTVLTEVMGGGFGSKFSAEVWGVNAVKLSQKTGRPVKVFLDRAQEHLAAGNRPSGYGHVKLGADSEGRLVAMIADTHATPGRGGGAFFPLPYVYDVPAYSRTHADVYTNGGGSRAMRAPGHPQGCAIMEAAMDDLADKLGIDPLEFRLKNLPAGDSRTAVYKAEVKLGAKLIGWSENRKPRGKSGTGTIRHGYGMALHTWGGGGAQDSQVICNINPDGSVELKIGTQDIGTGARTILAIIAAELLGLQVTDITSNIGNSTFPHGQPSGGSTTSPSISPPAYAAVTQARDALFKKLAPTMSARPEDLSLANGTLFVNEEARMSWKEACRKLGTAPISETGKFVEKLTSVGVGGCQFAHVVVDIETGVVRAKKIVAIQDSGLILDLLTWESQVYGGVIGGLNYGLFEERVMDPITGRMLNPDMELYKLAGATDIPEIIVRAYDPPEQRKRGVIGVGEPPTISTAAAIGNAVTNAIGVRVHEWPMSPRNVLNALANKSHKNGEA
jgi:xanthine dehydrogenase YagR molybdenum-binding subunit